MCKFDFCDFYIQRLVHKYFSSLRGKFFQKNRTQFYHLNTYYEYRNFLQYLVEKTLDIGDIKNINNKLRTRNLCCSAKLMTIVHIMTIVIVD